MSTFGYRPFGIDPSKLTVLTAAQQRQFEEHASHLRPKSAESGPPDPVAGIFRDGRWLSAPVRGPLIGIAWRPLRPAEKTLELDFDRGALAS